MARKSLIAREVKRKKLVDKYAELRAQLKKEGKWEELDNCLLYTSPSPRDATLSRMPSSA